MIWYLSIAILTAVVGYIIGKSKGMEYIGLALGFFLGIIGVIIIVLLPGDKQYNKWKQDNGSVTAGILAGVGCIILLALIVVGGWKANWWLKKEVVNKNAAISEQSRPAQVGLRTGIEHAMSDLDLTPGISDAQRQHIVLTICEQIGRLNATFTTPSITQFKLTECN